MHSQTTLEANKVSLTSKGDTTLAGAKATANRINADVGGKLSIISQQDQIEQKIDQSGAGARVQASLGTAWQASGNLSNSSANGSSNSVNQQAGLFAGDGGYHVKADQVDLKGGAIVSTAKKENNDLTANSLNFSDINNKSSYDATSVSLSGGTSFNKDKSSGDGKASNPTNNDNWRNATSFSPSLPQYESDKDSSVTRATLSEGNITIGGQATTTTALGIHSDASTAHRSVDTLPNLQEILDKQKTVADATSTIVAATRTYSQNQQKQAEEEKKNTEQTAIAELQAKGGEDWNKYQDSNNEAEKQELLKNNSPSYKQASETAQDWGMGGDKSRAVNAVAMAVTGALGGQTDLQVAANALAPYAANIIGKELGHGEDKNKAAQLAAHAILGAALAYVNGGNPAAGGSAAVASEAAADYLTNQYKDKKEYQDVNGEFQPNLLPEDVKTQIRDLTAAIGAVVGGTVGDSAFNAQLSGVVAQNAVENNALLGDDIRKKAKDFFSDLSSKVKHPIDQGVINGVATVADGLLVIADAFGDTAVSAIHCPLGTSACADAMENNRKKGEAVYQFLINLDLKEQANKVKQSYADLNSGDPEKVANAQRVQAEVFTSLGLSATGFKKLGYESGQVGSLNNVKRILQNDPATLPPVKASTSGNISAKQISENGKIIDPPKEVLNKQQQLLNNTDNNKSGGLREEIADSYFKNSGYTKLESKCGSNCFDGVYTKNGELYIVEVKPLKERGSVKLNSANQSTGLDVQMSDKWIVSRAKALRETGNADAIRTANLIDKAIDSNKPVNKIVVGINQSRTVTMNLGNEVKR